MPTPPAVVELRGVSKKFTIHHEKSLKERVVSRNRRRAREDFWALHDVELNVAAGSSVGLVGANGSGKSTLLKTIGGIISPTTGTVRTRGRMAALLELGAGFHPDLTGRENIYLNASILGLSKRVTDQYFDAIVDFSGIERFIDTQVKFYSSGMYVRLAFAVAVHVDPDVLLVDEVLAVGDEPFQRKCLDRIRSFQAEGRTIVLVTHALDQMVDICDRGVVLDGGRILFDGDPGDAARTLREDFATTREEDQAKAREEVGAAPGARVTQVTLLGAGGSPATVLHRGEHGRVRVRVETDEPLEDWILGIGVDSPSGQGLWGTHTRLLGKEMPRLVGSAEIEFDLGQLHIGRGQYLLHGALAMTAGPEIHRMANAWQFTIEAEPNTVGPLGLSVRTVSGPSGVTAVAAAR